MDDGPDAAEDERATELATITAIFPELVTDPSDPFSASLDIPVTPAKPLPILFPPVPGGAQPATLLTPPSSDGSSDPATVKVAPVGPTVEIRYLSHLPPLLLNITLPPGYPANAPPIVELQSQSAWLPDTKLKELKDSAAELWGLNGCNQVVYDYIDSLQQAAEVGFDLVQKGGGALEISQDLELALLDFDLKAKRAKFEQETFDCGVCLEPKKGAVCHRLQLCGHVFCLDCLQGFYNNCIAEGDIVNVKCLAPGCGRDKVVSRQEGAQLRRGRRKDDRTLEPSELLQINLEQSMVQRYVTLKRKKMLESDRTTVYCPRQWCQGPARSQKQKKPDEPEDDEAVHSDEQQPSTDPIAGGDKLPPPGERLAVCEDCSFAFCSVCKTGWHGEFAKCFPRRQYELSAEEKASEEYLKKHSTPCPTCGARAQKTMGCNHMICFKCNTHFCYLCSSWLIEDNPYVHFNTAWLPCYQRLWELEEGDGIGVDRNRPLYNLPADVEDDGDDDDDGGDDDDDDPGWFIPPAAPAPPQVRPPVQVRQIQGIRINRRAQNGLAPVRPPLNLVNPEQGLQRFLRLAENDEEDEWDSEELDEDDSEDEDGGNRWEIPVR